MRVDLVFKIGGIGKEERTVKADHLDKLAFLKTIGHMVMERLVVIQRQGCDRRAHAFIEKYQQRQPHTDKDSPVQMGRKDKCRDKGDNGNGAVIPLGAPGVDKTGNIDQVRQPP